MKYILCVFLFGMLACDYGPPCPPISNDDFKSGIFSRDLGSVQIDGESCRIFETYERSYCQKRGPWSQQTRPQCDGERVECYDQVLTRITKCPNSTTVNTITHTNDKFHREEVK
jgi:hypothetical protein